MRSSRFLERQSFLAAPARACAGIVPSECLIPPETGSSTGNGLIALQPLGVIVKGSFPVWRGLDLQRYLLLERKDPICTQSQSSTTSLPPTFPVYWDRPDKEQGCLHPNIQQLPSLQTIASPSAALWLQPVAFCAVGFSGATRTSRLMS